MDALLCLPDADLRALVSALRTGRLTPPFTQAAVGMHCVPALTGRAAVRLQELSKDGMAPAHLVLLLESILATRASRPSGGDVLELVCTGPHPDGVSSRDTGVVVRELFGAAEQEVLVVGYAVHRGKEVFRALADRMAERPQMVVRMVLDVSRHPTDTTSSAELVARFSHRFRTQEWPGERLPELFHDPRSLSTDRAMRSSMHAKCVVIDRRTAFVSSANFTEAAQVRNVEVGALIHSSRFAGQLWDHVDALIARNCLTPLSHRA